MWVLCRLLVAERMAGYGDSAEMKAEKANVEMRRDTMM